MSDVYSQDQWVDDLKRVYDLRGKWKFSIGDNMNWKEAEFNDNSWEEIFVPSPWEDEGYPGYDGYAWYRKKINISQNDHENSLYLRLGYIDDIDEVYINGHFMGFSGSFPPNYYTAYQLDRVYKIPEIYLNHNGENVIAVRIYDAELTGGIIRGKVGIYEMVTSIAVEIPLEGRWKFLPGDEPERKEMNYNDWDWHDVMVPAPWETQGFREYDGYAWYRKSVVIPAKYRDQDLVLLLGKIDDLDETFFNGNLIGSTGNMSDYSLWIEAEWQVIRGYSIDRHIINYDRDNVIAVRIYDGLVQGGIYEGPIGIVTEENYKKWKKKAGRKDRFFDFLFRE
jgi:sialate O-acetylesterase